MSCLNNFEPVTSGFYALVSLFFFINGLTYFYIKSYFFLLYSAIEFSIITKAVRKSTDEVRHLLFSLLVLPSGEFSGKAPTDK